MSEIIIVCGAGGKTSYIKKIAENNKDRKIVITTTTKIFKPENYTEIINNHFNEYYIVNKDVDISKLILQPEEVSEVKWFEKNDIIKRINNNYEEITDKEGCWDYLKRYYEWRDKNN